uniref:Cyclic nucleotide-binding domain-containing protein n=1 Tax=Globisporangium ultimum (strain ATCC 200006 / CBS 805.95 / DAOM BR144) TaxID=431595 RepID=K3WJD5_GLOUD
MSEKDLDAKQYVVRDAKNDGDYSYKEDHDDIMTKKLKVFQSDSKYGGSTLHDDHEPGMDSDECYTEGDDDSDRDDLDDEVDMREIAVRLGSKSATHRRSVVSSFVPMDAAWTPPVHPKSDQDEHAIRRSIRRNLLFSNISEETLQILVNAMKYVAVKKGTDVIVQGEAGDLFYIIDSGVCEVLLNGRVFGEIDGTSERNFFGELALLYDSPRAATIRALTDIECWSLDRVTFKRVLMDTTIKQRQLYLDFLDQVPIFSTLSQYEKMIVADALRVRYYEPGARIIEEGSAGDDFYIVEDGEVMCTKGHDEVSARLGSGDFFGELALITNDLRMASVTAVRKTKCLVLDRKTFKRLLGPMQEHLRKRADLYELYMSAHPTRFN